VATNSGSTVAINLILWGKLRKKKISMVADDAGRVRKGEVKLGVMG